MNLKPMISAQNARPFMICSVIILYVLTMAEGSMQRHDAITMARPTMQVPFALKSMNFILRATKAQAQACFKRVRAVAPLIQSFLGKVEQHSVFTA